MTFYQSYLRRCTPEQFARVRVALSGAAKLSQALADAWKAKFGSQLMEGYGCTELSPVVSANLPGGDEAPRRARSHRPGSIGRPLPGVAVRIVDQDAYRAARSSEALEKQGSSSPRGPTSCRATSGCRRRRPSPIDGWYTTGDIGHLDRDGFLFITDRLSRFSKIGGEMVPHGRVEEALQDLAMELSRGHEVALDEDAGPRDRGTAVEDEKKEEQLVVLHAASPFDGALLHEGLGETDLPNPFQPKPAMYFEVGEIPMP